MINIKAQKSVYAYYLPETRKAIDAIVRNFPHDVYLKSIFPGLDDFHCPIIKKFIKRYEFLSGLSGYEYQYYVNGSSEGIFHILAFIKTNHPDLPIYFIGGEYEGYGAYAKSLKLNTHAVAAFSELAEKEKGFVFVSNPSAVNGNIIKNSEILKICEWGHKVIYDCAYAGTTKYHKYALGHPNILAVLCSFSKPYGLFYHRVGFAFSRMPIESLYANKWFKNIASLMYAEKIIDTFDMCHFHKKYKKLQAKALEVMKRETGISAHPSDTYLLSYITQKEFESLSPQQQSAAEIYRRGKYYRFSLTPYFLEIENEKHSRP